MILKVTIGLGVSLNIQNNVSGEKDALRVGNFNSFSRLVHADMRYFKKQFYYLSITGLSLEDTMG